MAERESPVVTVSRPRMAMASIALMIASRFLGSLWVLRPRFWSEMRVRRSCLADCDWVVMDEQVILGCRRRFVLVVRCRGDDGLRTASVMALNERNQEIGGSDGKLGDKPFSLFRRDNVINSTVFPFLSMWPLTLLQNLSMSSFY